MTWDDVGFLVSKNKYSENSLIVEIFTKNHGKVTGLVFGGTSKKIKSYLQLGNKFFVNYNSKNENKIGFFKLEIVNAQTPLFFDDKNRLSCLVSAMQLIKILNAEAQTNQKIYRLIENFFLNLQLEDWIKRYIFWELELFSHLGYNLELKNLVSKKIINNEIKYNTNSSYEKKEVPNFLIDQNVLVEKKDLLAGLKLVGDFLDKSILKPNNLSFPSGRLYFVNIIQ